MQPADGSVGLLHTRRRRRRAWIAAAGALAVVAGGTGGAIAAVATRPTERERSRDATERPCERPYVEVEAEFLDKPRLTFERIGQAEQPSALAVDPQGRRPVLLAEREGRVRIVDGGGIGEIVLEIDDTSDHGDGGLLALAYDPTADWLYALRTTAEQDDVLSAFPIGSDGRPRRDGEVELLRSGHGPSEQHHGGALVVGADGFLYVGFGDGGGLGDPRRTAQRPSALLGKILRIAPTPGEDEPYRIPSDNPFAGLRGWRPEIWAYGVRNPYRMSLDPATGDLWLGDVGQSCWEEVTRLTAADAGANLGWDRFEGTAPFQAGDLGGDVVWPDLTYSHLAGWCALVLGPVVRGDRLPDLDGWVLHTDYCRGRIHAFAPGDGRPAGRRPRVVDTGLRLERPAAIVEGPDGFPWVLSLDGDVLRIVPRG